MDIIGNWATNGRLLLKMYCSQNIPTLTNITFQACRVLLEHGASLDMADDKSQKAIHLAAHADQVSNILTLTNHTVLEKFIM